jgi:hypothetical protein
MKIIELTGGKGFNQWGVIDSLEALLPEGYLDLRFLKLSLELLLAFLVRALATSCHLLVFLPILP